MKRILVILCSPRRDGFTEFLADGFLKGATQAGAEVRKMSVRGKKLLPCRHCCYCGEHGGQCAIQDDYEEFRTAMDWADLIAFASPLYFWTISAQMKIIIDRMFAAGIVNSWKYPYKEAMLLMTCGENSDFAFDQPYSDYRNMLERSLGWEDRGYFFLAGTDIDPRETGIWEEAVAFGRTAPFALGLTGRSVNLFRIEKK